MALKVITEREQLSKVELRTATAADTVFDKAIKDLYIRSEYGKDEKATSLLRKFALGLALMKPRDFWNYLYDWVAEYCETYHKEL